MWFKEGLKNCCKSNLSVGAMAAGRWGGCSLPGLSIYAESFVLSSSIINPICLLPWVFACSLIPFFGSADKNLDSRLTTIPNARIQVLTLPLSSNTFWVQAPNCFWTCLLIFKWKIESGKFLYVIDPLMWTIWENYWKLNDVRWIVDGIEALIWVRQWFESCVPL